MQPRLSLQRVAIAVAWTAVVVVGCYAPTELSLALSTDASCDVVTSNGIVISVAGSSAALADALPVATSFACSTEQGNLGTLTLTPSAAAEHVVIQVVLGVDRRTSACRPPTEIDGCIVARRRVSYLRHQSLRVPIRLDVSCKGISCGIDETCDRGGCVPAEIRSCIGDECGLSRDDGGAGFEGGGPRIDGAVIDPPGPDGAVPSDTGAPCSAPPSACPMCPSGSECCIATTQAGGIQCVPMGTCPQYGALASSQCSESCQCQGNPFEKDCLMGLECPVKVCGGDCRQRR